MKIFKAKHIGFCSGIKRAINFVENEVKSGKKVYILGELLHNKQEVNRLVNLGVEIIEDLDQLQDKNCTLVIRTHGIKKDLYEKLTACNNLKLIDGTCPIVKKNQKIVQKWSNEGYNIVVYGDKKHPEIVALMSYISPKVKSFIISKPQQVDSIKLDSNDKVLVIAQTTKEVEEYWKIVEVIRSKFKNVKVINTICRETINREKETTELAKKVDLLIVIGGKHSSNTNKLARIAKKYNDNVAIISTEDEVKQKYLRYKTIGIVSGTSTPVWQVEKILERFGV